MKEIDLNIVSITIPANKNDYYYERIIKENKVIIHKKHKSRKIKAQWTPELVDELRYYHGIDTEQELIILLNNDSKI